MAGMVKELREQRDSFLLLMREHATIMSLMEVCGFAVPSAVTGAYKRLGCPPRGNRPDYSNMYGMPLSKSAVRFAWAKHLRGEAVDTDALQYLPGDGRKTAVRQVLWTVNDYFDVLDRVGTEPLENIATDYGMTRYVLLRFLKENGDDWRIWQHGAQMLVRDVYKVCGLKISSAVPMQWRRRGLIRGYFEKADETQRARFAKATYKTDRRAEGGMYILDPADYASVLMTYEYHKAPLPGAGEKLEAEIAYEIDMHDKAVAHQRAIQHDKDYRFEYHQREDVKARKNARMRELRRAA